MVQTSCNQFYVLTHFPIIQWKVNYNNIESALSYSKFDKLYGGLFLVDLFVKVWYTDTIIIKLNKK